MLSNFYKSSVVRIDNEKYDVVNKTELNGLIENEKKQAADAGPSSVYEKHNLDMQAVYTEKGNALMDEAREKSRAILEEARLQAAQMVSEARLQSDEITQQAYDKGMQQALGESAAMIEKAKLALTEALDNKEQLMALWEREMIDLAVRIARKVIGDIIEIDSYALTQIYKNAVDRIKAENDQIRLKLGPGSFNAIIPDDLGVEVVLEKKAGDSELIAETENGDVNISIDSQIEQIRKGFMMLMGEL